MKTLTLILALATLAVPAFADSAACGWKTADNGNFLVRTGDCDDGLTGGYFVVSVTRGIVGDVERTITTYNGRPAEGPRQTIEDRPIPASED